MSRDIEINGDINISGDILIYGKVYGNINSTGVINTAKESSSESLTDTETVRLILSEISSRGFVDQS